MFPILDLPSLSFQANLGSMHFPFALHDILNNPDALLAYGDNSFNECVQVDSASPMSFQASFPGVDRHGWSQ